MTTTKTSSWTVPVSNMTTGQIYISTSSGGGGAASTTWGDVNPGTLKVPGTAEFAGDIVLQGKSLSETLNKINERLAILVPNQELEAEYAELAALRQQYVELERELREKQQVFDILKKR